MWEIATSVKDPYNGSIKIGIIPTLGPYLLPHILPTLSKTFPNLQYYLVENQTAELEHQLKHGKLDVIIAASSCPEADFVCELLFIEEFLLAVSPSAYLRKT